MKVESETVRLNEKSNLDTVSTDRISIFQRKSKVSAFPPGDSENNEPNYLAPRALTNVSDKHSAQKREIDTSQISPH